jgi:hypothetical protein
MALTDPEPMRKIKQFVFEGVLAGKEVQHVAKNLGLGESDLLTTSLASESTDPSWYAQDLVVAARRMSQVYFRLYLFENKVTQMVDRVLSESKGDGWFQTGVVPEPIVKEATRRREAEGMARFHRRQGDKLVDYVSLPDLGKIIEANWTDFETILYRKEWMLGKFEDLRLIRNATAHMGEVSDDDLDRLDVILKDWNRQVG